MMASEPNSEITQVLCLARLEAFIQPFANYGMMTIADLNGFSDRELQSEFQMNNVQIKKFWNAVDEAKAANPLLLRSSSPERNDMVGDMKRRQSQTMSDIRSSWGVDVGSGEFGDPSSPAHQNHGSTTSSWGTSSMAQPVVASFDDDDDDVRDFEDNGDETVTFFLEVCGLDRYLAAFREFGVRQVEDFFDAELLSDQDLRTDIGMNESEVRTFRNTVNEQVSALNTAPQPSNTPPVSASGPPPSSSSFSSSSNVSDRIKKALPTPNIFGKAPKPKEPKYNFSSESATALDSMLPPPEKPVEKPKPPQPPARRLSPPPPPPPKELKPPRLSTTPPPQPSSQPSATKTTTTTPSANSFSLSDAAASLPAPTPTVPPPAPTTTQDTKEGEMSWLTLALKKVSENERPKVEIMVSAALRDLKVQPQALVNITSKPKTDSVRSWTEGVSFLRGLRSSPQLVGPQSLSLPYDDLALLGHEPAAMNLLRTFVAGPIKAASGAQYIQCRNSLVNSRIESQSAKASLQALTLSIQQQREAGDLDAALLGQAQLVGKYEKSIGLVKEAYAGGVSLLTCLTTLASSLATLAGANPTEADTSENSDRLLKSMQGLVGSGGGGFSQLAAAAAASVSANKGIMEAEKGVQRQKQNGLDAAIKRLLLFSEGVEVAFQKERERIERGKMEVEADVLVLEERKRTQEGVAERLALGLDDDEDEPEPVTSDRSSPAPMGWISTAAAEEREKMAALEEAERSRCEKRLAMYASHLQALAPSLQAGDKVAFLEEQAKQARALSAELDSEAKELNDRRRMASVTAHRADETRKRILQTRENKKVASGLIIASIEERVTALRGTCKVYDLTLALLLVLEKRALWIATVLQTRFEHVERCVSREMNQCSLEHLDLASDFVTYMSTLVKRKERNLEHLAARLFEHARERVDAIERDNPDDVRRADRDKEETLKGQEVARRALASVREQKVRALSDLVGCLVQAGGRPLGLKLEHAARLAYDLASKEAEAEGSESVSGKALLSALSEVNILGGGEDGEDDDQEDTHDHAGQRLEEQFCIPEDTVEKELEQDIGFGAGVSGVPYSPEPEPEQPPPPPSVVKAPVKSEPMIEPSPQPVPMEEVNQSAVTAPANTENSAAEDNDMVYVQMVVPKDAAPGSYLQASVNQDGQDYHFSVVVPTGALPGETTLTVPVPIPKNRDTSQPKPLQLPPPQPQQQGETSEGGLDVLASFFMDKGLDPGVAIQAAQGLVSSGVHSVRAVQSGDMFSIAVASKLTESDLRRVFDNRNPQDVDRALTDIRSSQNSAMSSRRASTGRLEGMEQNHQQQQQSHHRRSSTSDAQGGRQKTYSIDGFEEEPLVRRGDR